MDVELLIHGVPDGQKFFGIKEEQTNMGLFYDNSIESVKFVIETKKQGNTAYTYYSYLRYKGLIEAGGRTGGYFGMTLRIDKYYQDAIHIYNLLDILFKRHIVGTILTPSGGGYKYIVTNFATKTEDINRLQQGLIQLIQDTCVSEKFLDIDASFIHPITLAAKGNITDVTEGSILTYIKKYSKVVLSPDYESNMEKEYKQKLRKAEDLGGDIITQKDKKIEEQDKTIKSLETQIVTRQQRIKALEEETKQKGDEIQSLRKKGDLAQLIDKLKEPITSLADYFRIKDPKPQPPTFKQKNFLLGIISCALSVGILVLCIVSLCIKDAPASQDIIKLKSEISILKTDKQKLTKEIGIKSDSIRELSQQKLHAFPDAYTQTLRIDISRSNGGSYSGGDVKPEKEYILRVYDIVYKKDKSKKDKKILDEQYTSGGTWNVTGAERIDGKITDDHITIKTNSEGKLQITYEPTAQGYKKITRTENIN